MNPVMEKCDELQSRTVEMYARLERMYAKSYAERQKAVKHKKNKFLWKKRYI